MGTQLKFFLITSEFDFYENNDLIKNIGGPLQNYKGPRNFYMGPRVFYSSQYLKITL